MIGNSEFTFQFYDNQSDEWRKATVVANTTSSAIELIDEVIPLQRRTRQSGKQDADSLHLRNRSNLNNGAYLVAIETVANEDIGNKTDFNYQTYSNVIEIKGWKAS